MNVVSSKTFWDVPFERTRKCLEVKTSNLKRRVKVIDLMQQKPPAMMRSIFSTKKKPPSNFKRRSIDKHTLALHFNAFWSTRIWRASAAETCSSWKMQMELDVYISLKDKLKPKLKLSQLQIYWVNEILLLFSRSINKDTRVHEKTKRTLLCGC